MFSKTITRINLSDINNIEVIREDLKYNDIVRKIFNNLKIEINSWQMNSENIFSVETDFKTISELLKKRKKLSYNLENGEISSPEGLILGKIYKTFSDEKYSDRHYCDTSLLRNKDIFNLSEADSTFAFFDPVLYKNYNKLKELKNKIYDLESENFDKIESLKNYFLNKIKKYYKSANISKEDSRNREILFVSKNLSEENMAIRVYRDYHKPEAYVFNSSHFESKNLRETINKFYLKNKDIPIIIFEDQDKIKNYSLLQIKINDIKIVEYYLDSILIKSLIEEEKEFPKYYNEVLTYKVGQNVINFFSTYDYKRNLIWAVENIKRVQKNHMKEL